MEALQEHPTFVAGDRFKLMKPLKVWMEFFPIGAMGIVEWSWYSLVHQTEVYQVRFDEPIMGGLDAVEIKTLEKWAAKAVKIEEASNG